MAYLNKEDQKRASRDWYLRNKEIVISRKRSRRFLAKINTEEVKKRRNEFGKELTLHNESILKYRYSWRRPAAVDKAFVFLFRCSDCWHYKRFVFDWSGECSDCFHSHNKFTPVAQCACCGKFGVDKAIGVCRRYFLSEREKIGYQLVSRNFMDGKYLCVPCWNYFKAVDRRIIEAQEFFKVVQSLETEIKDVNKDRRIWKAS